MPRNWAQKTAVTRLANEPSAMAEVSCVYEVINRIKMQRKRNRVIGERFRSEAVASLSVLVLMVLVDGQGPDPGSTALLYSVLYLVGLR